MVGETASFEEAQAEASAGKREQSTIAFPYLALDAAEEVANAVYSRSGYGSCDLDELAAEMGQVISGAFRLKTGSAKIFDVIDKDGRSSVKLTDLGKQLVNEDTRRAARVEAFLRVPLYAAIFEKYRGQKLPPMKALEREMAALGVASKQTDKARQAFERSARQAGFFDSGDDRLIRPKVDLPTASETKEDDQRHDRQPPKRGGGGGDDGDHDPLILGLVRRLPEAGADWNADARAAWLRLAISIFDVVYEGNDGDISVEVASHSAMRRMQEHMKRAADE